MKKKMALLLAFVFCAFVAIHFIGARVPNGRQVKMFLRLGLLLSSFAYLVMSFKDRIMRKRVALSLLFTLTALAVVHFIGMDTSEQKQLKMILQMGIAFAEFTFIVLSCKDTFMTRRVRTVLILGWMTLLLSFSYGSNFFTPHNDAYELFQYDSELLVENKIHARIDGVDTGAYGLGGYDKASRTTYDYVSQYGLQGKVFQLLCRLFIKHLLCIVLTALVLSAICFLIRKKYNLLCAVCFFVTFLLSQWIVNFAQNLYWVEFTWFVPMLLGLVCSMYGRTRYVRVLCCCGAFASILVKSLCGYEYLPVIMLAMISFLLVDFLVAASGRDKAEAVRKAADVVLMGICALAGFFVALVIHARLRGDGNVIAGLQSIYKKDVLRWSLAGTAEEAPQAYWAGLSASVTDLLRMYFNQWNSDIISGISGRYFFLLALLPNVAFMYRAARKELDLHKVYLYFVFLVTCIAWFVMGKSHSYYHGHMNFVLWYFGFVQVCFYILVDEAIGICRACYAGYKSLKEGKER